MAFILSDRVKEVTSTTGTSDMVLGGAVGAATSFSAEIGNNNNTYYCVETSNGDYEIGVGTYTLSSNILSRDTVISSSNSGSKITLTGVSEVFCTQPGPKAVFTNPEGLVSGVQSNFHGFAFPDGTVQYTSAASGKAPVTLERQDAGIFFNYFVNNAYDETVSLHLEDEQYPRWKMGLRDSATGNSAPTYGYIFAEQGYVGGVADSTSEFYIASNNGLWVKHNSQNIANFAQDDGIIFQNISSASPTFTVKGAAAQAQNLQNWNNSSSTTLAKVTKDGHISGVELHTPKILFGDGTIQTTAVGVSSGDNVSIFTNDAGYLTAHPSISAASSSDNATNVFIQDITVDSNGHVTAIGTASAFEDWNINSDDGVPYAISDGNTLQLVGGDNVTTSYNNSTKVLTITSTDTDTNTTYTAGDGLILASTEFSAPDIATASGALRAGITSNSTDITTASGALRGDITANTTAIPASGYAISGGLQPQITSNLAAIPASGYAISGALQVQIDGMSGASVSYVDAATASGVANSGHVLGIANADNTVASGVVWQRIHASGQNLRDFVHVSGENLRNFTNTQVNASGQNLRDYADTRVNASGQNLRDYADSVAVGLSMASGQNLRDYTNTRVNASGQNLRDYTNTRVNASGQNVRDFVHVSGQNLRDYTNTQVNASGQNVRDYTDTRVNASGQNLRDYADTRVNASGQNLRDFVHASGQNLRDYTDSVAGDSFTSQSGVAHSGFFSEELHEVSGVGGITLAHSGHFQEGINNRFNYASGVAHSGHFDYITYASGQNLRDYAASLAGDSFTSQSGVAHSGFFSQELHEVSGVGGLIATQSGTLSDMIATSGYAISGNLQPQITSNASSISTNTSNISTKTPLTSFYASGQAYTDSIALKSNIASPTFTGTPAAPTASVATNTTQVATTAFVAAEVAALVDSAPGTLNTLNELAAALGDDANYASTITAALALKAPIASPTFTGTVAIPNISDLETAVTDNTVKVTNVSTDLGITTSTTTVIITSSDGTNATIPVATTSVGGVMSKAIFDKLDGIEAGATADQSNAEIVAAVEAGTDSNTFTDADHSKLDGIEASADVTDTTNVVAALTAGTNVTISVGGTIASTDTTYSEATGLAEGLMSTAHHDKLDGIETSATADQTNAEIRTAVEAATDSNVFTDADHTKLNAIEASADVTDATNVTAAGALMDAADAIDSEHYTDGSIDEAHLNATNAATDNYLLSYDAASTGFTWIAAAGGGSMSTFIITDGTTPQTIDDGETITFADGVGAEFVTSATNTVTVNSVDSEIVHDNLSGFVANEHIDWTGASAGTIHATNYTDTVYTLPEATATAKGGIELFSDTDQSVAATAVSTTASRTYGLQLNAAGQGVVNVPWVDTNTTYTVGDGGLTQINFTSADNTKLDGIAANANNYSHTTNANLTGDVTSVGNATTIATDAVDIAMLSATGTASSSTFLRGDNTWVTPTDTTYSEATTSAEGLMSTAHHDKLDGIEASADVTDTANVTAAGALMDSELAGIAAVKATTGTFLLADESKLDGIEASADVTDTANVTAAGALMDSEVTNLATVKALATGISNGNFLIANATVADNDFLRIDGAAVEGRTAADVLSDIVAAPAAGNSSIVTVGALDAGSITSGFGNIDNGSSSIACGSLDVSDGAITNVGDIDCDSISIADAGTGLNIAFGGNTTLNKMTLTDNLADALNITEGSNSYMKFTTTDSATRIVTSVGVVGNPTALTSQSDAVVINAALGNYFTVATNGSITGLDIQNAIVGQKILIRFAWGGDHSLAYTDTVSFPANTAPTTTSGGVDVIGFVCTTASSAFDGFIVGEDLRSS